MKVAISIPDLVFKRADQVAKRLKKSRSQFYAEAVAEYAEKYDPNEVTEAYNRLADEMTDEDLEMVRENSRRILKRIEWK